MSCPGLGVLLFEVEKIQDLKKERGFIPFILCPAPRVGKINKILLYDWLPERAKWSYLARSVLPAASRKKNFPESIINPFLTKFDRSRWLDIVLVLFLRVYVLRLRFGP